MARPAEVQPLPLLDAAGALPDGLRLGTDETARTIALGDRIVPYVLRRARRRTIGLTIDQRGLRVGAPPRATLKEIEALIRRHGAWVASKLDEWRTRRQATTLSIEDGALLPFFGQTLTLRLTRGANRAQWTLPPDVPALTLALRTPADAGRVLERALQEHARAWFTRRLQHYGAQMQLPVPPLSLSSARTRWGSCSLTSGIRLNWRLVHFPPHVVDYVVVHELAHLREMNHSRRFWAIVGEHYPAYRSARDELKRLAPGLPIWPA